MLTATELLDAALSKAAGFGINGAAVSRSELLRRIGVRQEQLFMAATAVSPHFFARRATGLLQDGAADLDTLDGLLANPPGVLRLISVEIADEGASTYQPGDPVHVVPSDDVAAYAPPRATLLDRVIAGVDNDLADVVSIRVTYARRPLRVSGLASEVEVPCDSFAELLVNDLVAYLARRDRKLSPEEKAAAAGDMKAEDEENMGLFLDYVRGFAPVEDRFAAGGQGRTPHAR
jgi:hypothetical protein